MRWIPFFILAYLMLGLQIGLSDLLQLGSGKVNFVLIAAVFIAINAARDKAIVACFVLGLLHDLVGVGPVGLYALSYSLIAMLVAGTDRALSVDHPLTHFVLTLIGGILVAAVSFLNGRLAVYRVPVSLWSDLVTAFYSAVLSLPALWLLTRLRRSFRFRPHLSR